jgi:hypothetical protein
LYFVRPTVTVVGVVFVRFRAPLQPRSHQKGQSFSISGGGVLTEGHFVAHSRRHLP